MRLKSRDYHVKFRLPPERCCVPPTCFEAKKGCQLLRSLLEMLVFPFQYHIWMEVLSTERALPAPFFPVYLQKEKYKKIPFV